MFFAYVAQGFQNTWGVKIFLFWSFEENLKIFQLMSTPRYTKGSLKKCQPFGHHMHMGKELCSMDILDQFFD